MEEELYDEFGNYIGPEIDDSEEVELPTPEVPEPEEDPQTSVISAPAKHAVVLHEDKQYYEDSSSIYGPNVKITIQEEDTQSIDIPIIKPSKTKEHDYTAKLPLDLEKLPWNPTEYSKSFFENTMKNPRLIRNVAVIGALGHGKTTFVGSLIKQTHKNDCQEKRFMDCRHDEQERGTSLKAKPISLVLPNSQGKNFLINLIDTPGHPNFFDEVTAAINICDGALIVVDVIEGLTAPLEHLLKHVIQYQLDIVLVFNKMDRLIFELSIPPVDAYYKIMYVLNEINGFINSIPTYVSKKDEDHVFCFSPEKGNVIFASSEHIWSFSLFQMAQIYAQQYGVDLDCQKFAFRLWGDVYYNPKTRGFSTKPLDNNNPIRTFVQFVLDPIYKLYGQIVSAEKAELSTTLKSLNIHAKKELRLDSRSLCKLLIPQFFGIQTGLVDVLVENIVDSAVGADRKLPLIYSGVHQLKQVSVDDLSSEPLLIYITKLYPKKNSNQFLALGRIFRGTVVLGEKIRVLGETFLENEEDFKIETVRGVFTYNARYFISHNEVSSGNLVTLEGVDDIISKTATITQFNCPKDKELFTFHPLKFTTLPVVKIAVEPLNPAELPKLIEGLRKINKTYPLLVTRVEESGERIILGTGELYLDSVMYDLRKVFTDIEIKVAEPVVTFCETVVETSRIKCYAESANKHNKLSVIAQPLEPGLSDDIESGKVVWDENRPDGIRNYLKENYGWTSLAARNIWTFGPDSQSPNILVNETLPYEVDSNSLNSIRDHIIRGFTWASKDGPLCEEPMRNVKFKLLGATIASEQIHKGGNQIIPASRRVIYSSFLTATPRLMEPVYSVDIICSQECLTAVDFILSRRRGHIVQEKPKPGTPLHSIHAYLPCIDSFGFETDLRTHTQGQAFCLSMFDHWALVPGNPLDESIVLKPLDAAPSAHLARDFMVKTRRRKGLGQDITIMKFFDESLLAKAKEAEIDLF